MLHQNLAHTHTHSHTLGFAVKCIVQSNIVMWDFRFCKFTISEEHLPTTKIFLWCRSIELGKYFDSMTFIRPNCYFWSLSIVSHSVIGVNREQTLSTSFRRNVPLIVQFMCGTVACARSLWHYALSIVVATWCAHDVLAPNIITKPTKWNIPAQFRTSITSRRQSWHIHSLTHIDTFGLSS